jgi:hypothetical protein
MAIFGYIFSLTFLGAIAWTVWGAARDIIAQAQRMHQRPCARCRYFTNDHRLKCPVHPQIANTEAAIACRDFQKN